MRKIVLAFFAIPALVLLAVVFAPPPPGDQSGPRRNFSGVSRPAVAEPVALARLVPKTTYTRTIHATATIDSVDKQIDRCRGPVAVLIQGGSVLVAEHDYCGGAAWIGKINVGQAVKLAGPGIDPGIYVADELRYELRGKAKVSDLPDYDVVLQTCVTKSELVLVGMTRVAEVNG